MIYFMLFFSIFYQIKLDEYTKIVYNIIVVEGRSSRKEEYERRIIWMQA